VYQHDNNIENKYFHESKFAAKGFHNFEFTSQLPRHSWYYLKEGFSASLVEEAITCKLTRADQKLHILEPFCGTGTTPLTAALTGHFCTAIEVNPFLAFTARVKTITGRWHKMGFLSNLDKVVSSSFRGKHSHLEGFSTFTEGNSLSKWLFNRSVLRRFSSLMEAIDSFGGVYSDAMKLSAIVAAYNCCNAKRDGKALRYKPNWRELRYSGKDLIRQFQLHALTILHDILEQPIDHEFKPAIHTGDSRAELSALEDGKFDLVVTSPPYLNSFDYSDIYRPELFLGEYVKDNKDLWQIRLATVRSHIQARWSDEVYFQSAQLTPILEDLNKSESLWHKRIPLMVRAYFDDMWKIFKAIKPKMRKNGQVWMVVSTSAYGGVHIPVDFIVADAAHQAGFSLDGIHRLRHLRAAGQQWKQFKTKTPPLRESLIIMRNG